MPEPIFEDPRLVAIYDSFDGARHDLNHYLFIARELGAKCILDVGCGTGSLACLLSEQGFEVTGLDPAKASLDFARRKRNASHIRWIHGDATKLPPANFDLVVMTGNVAQVFLTDEMWEENLRCIHRALKPNGHLVFEVRDPAKAAWLEWNREKTYRRLNIFGTGNVESWCEVTEVSNELVSFRWTYVFEVDGHIITSDSTLRFQGREEIERSLEKTGYVRQDVRDAPDRPGKEFVFIASKSQELHLQHR